MKVAAMLRPFLAALAALFSSGAFALDVDPAFDRFKVQVLNNTARVHFGTNGTPLAGPGGPLISTGAGGSAFLSRAGQVATPLGNVAFTASQRFSGAALVRGATAIAFNPVLALALAGASPFIYDWFSDADISFDSQGRPLITTDAVSCSGYPQQPNFTACGGFDPPTPALPVNQYLPAGYVFKQSGSAWESACYAVDSCTGGGGYDWWVHLGPPVIGGGSTELATEEQVRARLASTSRSNSEIERILAEGLRYPDFTPDPEDTPQILDPKPSPSQTTTSQSVDPATGTTTTTRSCSMIGKPSTSGDTLTFSEICTTATTTTPPGGTTSTTSVSTVTSTIGVGVSPGTPQEPAPFEMPCGVAGTPPCNVKVDETGTPTAVPELADPEALARSPYTPYEQLKTNPSAFWPSLPTINWTFALPTGCGVITVPGFAPFLDSIDICPWQALFHEIMSVVWVLGGLFGAISTFWRNTFATS